MTTATKVYVVTSGQDEYLVRATNKAKAIRMIARDTICAEVASQEMLDRIAKECKEVIDEAGLVIQIEREAMAVS